MTNNLDDLKAMMDNATPRPDAARRAGNLALAQKNFDDLQGSRTAPRPTPVTGPKGLWTGVKTMLNNMTSKGALTTTTALVACGFLFITPQGQDLLRAPSAPQITMTDFDRAITAPQIEGDVTSEMTTQEAPADIDAEVLQEPLIVPDQELAPTIVTNPELRGRNIEEVATAPSPQNDREIGEISFGEPAPVAPTPAPESAQSAAPTQEAGHLGITSSGQSLGFNDNRSITNQDDGSGFYWEGNLSASTTLDNGLTAGANFENEGIVFGDTGPAAEKSWTSAGDMEADGPALVETAPTAPIARLQVAPTAPVQAPNATNQSVASVVDRIASSSRPAIETEDTVAPVEPNTETFANAETNPLKITSDTPVSTFSIDVDTAAYSVVRSSLSRGQLPPTGAVRIEELINYFPYAYPAPDADEAPFRPTVSTFQTPWNENTQLVHIALQGEMPALDDRPPLNLVFLIDTSGSMNNPTKLPLLKQSFRLMLDQLRPTDEVAIVEYAGSAGQVLAPTAASERTTILQAIQSLGAGGSTNGQGGLEQAYAVAESMKADGEVNRVILATDGDFNVGIRNPDALKDFIAGKRETGTYLSVLGFGRGNLDDATMQALAQNGNGTAAYIDTLSEAQKVLVDQLSGALFPIAGDVKVQVEFNPAQVAEYRLIGYETRALNREDFNNDAVDAGELGAGHSVTAIYEITPVGSPAQLSDPLRYGESTVAAQSDEVGYVKLRYKEPGEDVSQLIETPIAGSSTPGTEANFAAAIAGFGQLLRNPQYLGDWGYDEAIALANANRGSDNFGYRTEATQLMRLAQSLSR